MSLVLAAMADESCSSGSFDPTSLAKAKSDFETKGYAVLHNVGSATCAPTAWRVRAYLVARAAWLASLA